MRRTNERAGTAPTVPALNSNRLAGRPTINPHTMEVTMVTDSTPGPVPATCPDPRADFLRLWFSAQAWQQDLALALLDALESGEAR